MQGQAVISIKVVRPNQDDRVVRLEAPLTASEARDELKTQLKVEGSLQLDNVILRSARQLEINCLYTLLAENAAGKYSDLAA